MKQKTNLKNIISINKRTMDGLIDYKRTDNIITDFEEHIDADILNFIVNNREIFEPIMKKNRESSVKSYDEDDEYNHFTIASKYLNKYKNGTVKVEYKQNNNIGRYFAVGSLSLQSLAREIRQSICKDYYTDIDIKNAHPVFLSHICKIYGIECPILNNYISNRNKFFKDNKLSKNVGKVLFLEILNGGKTLYKKIESPTDELKTFYVKEIKNIHNSLCEIFEEKFTAFKLRKKSLGNKMWNLEAKFVNTILCDLESKILNCILDYYNNDKQMVLCFDGLLIPTCKYNEKELPIICDKVYKEFGIRIELLKKEFEDCFDLDGYDIPLYVPKKNNFKDVKDLLKGDDGLARIFYRNFAKDNVKFYDEKGNCYCFNHKTALWKEFGYKRVSNLIPEIINPIIETEISKNTNIRSQLDPETNKEDVKMFSGIIDELSKLIKKLSMSSFRKGIVDSLLNSCFDENFYKQLNKTKHLLPIQGNKVINLKTLETRKRTKDDFFTFECPVKYKPDYQKETVLTYMNDVFVNNKELVDYCKRFYGYCLTGEVNEKIFSIAQGSGDNSKSVFINILQKMLGDFATTIPEESLMVSKNKSGSGATPDLVSLMFARLAIVSESDDTSSGHSKNLNSVLIKKVTGDDDISIRQLYKPQQVIKSQSKILLVCNQMPKFNFDDKAMINRVRKIPYLAKFKRNKENSMYVENLQTDFLNDFFSYFCEGAYEWYNGNELIPTKLMEDEIKKYYIENDSVTAFIENCCIIDDSVEVQARPLYDAYNTFCINACIEPETLVKFGKSIKTKFTYSRKKSYVVYNGLTLIKTEPEEPKQIFGPPL